MITIDEDIRLRLVDLFDQSEFTRWSDSDTDLGLDFDFDYIKIKPDHAYWNPLSEMISRLCGCTKVGDIRVHRMGPDQYIDPHVDDAYPGEDTLVVRLNSGESRLEINKQIVEEVPGRGYIIPEGTEHCITKGQATRISMVAWITR